MRKTAFLLSLIGMALLLCFSGACLSAARNTLDLFFQNVLPALFPFYVLASLLYATGTLGRIAAKTHSRLLPCFLLGMLSGFPTGARLCGMLGKESRAACCNLCSPVFLMSVVAVGLCGNAQLFFPLAIAHWGGALLLSAALALLFPDDTPNTPIRAPMPANGDLFSAISEGMDTMLRILGCMLFFCVLKGGLSALLRLDLYPVADALLSVLIEVASGCHVITQLDLPTRVTSALLAACVSFGGLCVYAQAKLVSPRISTVSYLSQKLAHALIAALIAWFITPCFVPEQIPVLSSSAETYAENAVLGAALVYASAVGLASVYVIAVCIKKAQSRALSLGKLSINNRRLRPRPHRRPR